MMNCDPSSPGPADAESQPMPEFNSIPVETWEACESTIRDVLNSVCPTTDSVEKRREVTAYLQGIIRNAIGAEAFTYGSMPLKTFLPEGDIDLTIVSEPFDLATVSVPDSNSNQKSPLKEVCDVLMNKNHNGKERFLITDVQYIDAKVKLVKCIVDSIPVDISFNQFSGLCALCFLEWVNQRIGRDHLFKRSILLIKSWCYYESRILGSKDGLLSTYTVQTLVLYIFCMYNSSLTCPLMVLYKFLEYYRQFDWDNFCISIHGPVYKGYLPNKVVVDPVDFSGCGLNYLEEYMEMFTVPCNESTPNKPFKLKNLSIIDPLNENNNLGNSVYDNNFWRIKSALRLGGYHLGKILLSPKADIHDEIKEFFTNTMNMNPSTFVFEPRVISDDLPVKSDPEEVPSDYETDSDSDSLKADRGNQSNRNASQKNIGSAWNKFDNGNRNENGNGLDKGKVVATGGLDESINLSFANLKGDYDVNVRNLIDAECFHGYPYPPDYPWVWYQPNAPYGPAWSYPTSHMVHGRRTFIPTVGQQHRRPTAYPPARCVRRNWAPGNAYQMCSSSGTNNSRPSPQYRQGYGFEHGSVSGGSSNSPQFQKSPRGYGSNAPSQVQTERKLVFGAIDPSSATTPSGGRTYILDLGARKHAQRDPNMPIQFSDKGEFPRQFDQ